MEKLEIGKTRYTDLKKFLSEIVHLTGFEKIRERLKKLIPHLIKTENNGVWVDIQDILSSHLFFLIIVLFIQKNNHYELKDESNCSLSIVSRSSEKSGLAAPALSPNPLSSNVNEFAVIISLTSL